MMYQTTIQQRVRCIGVGLHGGKRVKLTLRPAAEDTGVVFHVPTVGGVRDIMPTPGAVTATGLATTLGSGEARVSTVEHLLAACRGLGVDNLHIDVEGGEVPIMDGSAAPFVMLLKEAGLYAQSKPRTVMRIKRPVNFIRDGKFIKAEPYNGFFVDYSIKFAHSAIGTQSMTLDLTPDSFARVAKARTFGFLRDVEMLKKQGLALGGSLDNAVVLDDRGVVNKDGLRYKDEFVRHKLLDFIGDMAMLPVPLQGRFTVFCSGHGLNNEFLCHIMQAKSLYLDVVKLGDAFEQPAAARAASRPAPGLPAPAYAG